MPDVMTIYGPIFYLSRGAGTPPIVAIHGAGGLGRYWGNQLAGLSRTTRFVTFDLPGHGRSTGQTHETIEEGAKRVIALMNVLGITHAVVMGHSMGAAIALWIALHHTERVQGLVLVGSGARLRVHSSIRSGIHGDWRATTRLTTEWQYAPETSPLVLDAATADLRHVDPDVLYKDYAAANAFDIMAEIGNIRTPTLVIVGEHDRMTPPASAEYLAHTMPNAQLQIIPQSGHMVMVEQAEAVNGAVKAFVERLQTRTDE